MSVHKMMFTRECMYFRSKILFTPAICCSGMTDLILQASSDELQIPRLLLAHTNASSIEEKCY